MLVNAHDHPGPALFQGIGFMVIAVWLFLRAHTGDMKMPKPREELRPPKKTKRKKFWEYANDPGNLIEDDK